MSTFINVFDEVAENYDAAFTCTPCGRELRRIVWQVMEMAFRPGARILELNCGTGEDAVWLAQRGVRVLATDNSPGMLEVASRKAARMGFSDLIEFQELDLAAPVLRCPDGSFDGALSNFGGMNCVPRVDSTADLLARNIRPGGHAIVVVMSRWCAWEILWELAHLRPRSAFRRVGSNGATGVIGSARIPVWYPTPGTVRRAFGTAFTLRGLLGLGVFLPPSNFFGTVSGRSAISRLLSRLERKYAGARILRCLGDHTLFDFERSPFETRVCI